MDPVTVAYGAGVVSANVRTWLDEGASVDDPQLGWQDLTSTASRGARVRVNGSLQTQRQRGKKTITESTLLFSFHFDDDWEPDSADNQAIYAALGVRATDLAAVGDGTGNVSFVTGTGAVALVHTHSVTPPAAAACVVRSLGR